VVAVVQFPIISTRIPGHPATEKAEWTTSSELWKMLKALGANWHYKDENKRPKKRFQNQGKKLFKNPTTR
jgi:hypothetical protein